METIEILKICDEIYIDSCALMETNSIGNFLSRYYNKIFVLGKRIIVLPAVRGEIAKHLSDPEKQPNALHALGFLQEYKDIFDLGEEVLSEEYSKKAFADPKFLSLLIDRRQYVTPLLITNDKMLAKDICEKLNTLDSYYGATVFSCFVRWDGELIQSTYFTDEPPQTEQEKRPVFEEPLKKSKNTPEKRWRITFTNSSDDFHSMRTASKKKAESPLKVLQNIIQIISKKRNKT